jgi:hypothetical protein
VWGQADTAVDPYAAKGIEADVSALVIEEDQPA